MTRPKTRAIVRVYEDGRVQERPDHVVTEEPLEIRIRAPGVERTIAVTMRTPGADFDLVAGFLWGEGVVAARDDIVRLSYCLRPQNDGQQYNVVTAELREPPSEIAGLDRHFLTTSSCGVCGKESIESLRARGWESLRDETRVDPAVILSLPATLRSAQGLFDATGGLHAAGLFDAGGVLVAVREDVGRHNAVDKLVGWALLEGRIPLAGHIVLVSGRTSYEIVQKCLAAQVPVVCAVSAPSSLAVAMAAEFGMTLAGFVREGKFNIYAGAERVKLPAHVEEQTVEGRSHARWLP